MADAKIQCPTGQVPYFNLGAPEDQWCAPPPLAQQSAVAGVATEPEAPGLIDAGLSFDAMLNIGLLVAGAVIVGFGLWRAKWRMPLPPKGDEVLELTAVPDDGGSIAEMQALLREVVLDMVADGTELETVETKNGRGQTIFRSAWRVDGEHLNTLCLLAGMRGGLVEAEDTLLAQHEGKFEARAGEVGR